MRQVFYVHSGITWLMTVGIIRTNSLNDHSVLILFGRGFMLPCEFEYYALDNAEQSIESIPSYGSRDVFLKRKTLKHLDQKLTQWVGGEDFVLYLPTERNYLMQYLQTHLQCARRDFIEEGLLTYQGTFMKQRASQSLQARLKYRLRFPFHFGRTLVGCGIHLHALDDFTVYVCTNTAWSVLSQFRVNKIDLPSLGGSFHQMIPDVKNLFIFDPVVEKGVCDPDIFRSCLKDFVRSNLSSETEVAIKFHPQQVSHELYLQVFDAFQIPFRVIGQDVIPEVLLMTLPSLRVFGLCSSVLFYAHEWGHKISSFSPILAEHSTSYQHWVKTSIPSFIIEDLKLL